MPELIIFIGLQASGKSTYYREHFAATHVHISKDLMKNGHDRERDQLRDGGKRVPDVAIYVTSKKLVPPKFEEGFDEIHVVA